MDAGIKVYDKLNHFVGNYVLESDDPFLKEDVKKGIYYSNCVLVETDFGWDPSEWLSRDKKSKIAQVLNPRKKYWWYSKDDLLQVRFIPLYKRIMETE